MENRERDRVSQRTTPTEAGQLNRQTEEQKGIRENSGTSAEFGQSIGRSENLSEGGEMNNRNHPRNSEDVSSRIKNVESESTRRSGQGSMGSSSGRSGSQSDFDRNEQSSGRNNEQSGNRNSGDSSSGRH